MVARLALPANTYAAGALTASANGAIPAQDGIAPAVGDRLLVVGEAVDWHNGIYTVTSLGSAGSPWVLTRATDCDETADMVAGASVFVVSGTLYAGTTWVERNAATPTSGTPSWWSTYIRGDHDITTVTGGLSGTGMELDLYGVDVGPVYLLFRSQVDGDRVRVGSSTVGELNIIDPGPGVATLTVDGEVLIGGQYAPSIGAGLAGMQSGRQQVGASIAAGGSRTDTITLPVAYADASYSVILTAQVAAFTAGGVLMQLNQAPIAGSFVVRTWNQDSVARQPTIHWLALHD